MDLQSAHTMAASLRASAPAANNTLAADVNQLADLRNRAGQNDGSALKEVAQHFESLFMQMMLKSMRDATEEGGLFNGDEMKFHQGMFDQQMSLHLSHSGGIGLAEIIERQLGGNRPASGGDIGSLENQWLKTSKQSVAAPVVTAAAQQQEFAPRTTEEFVRELWPHAGKAAQVLGVDTEVLVAQAALESGWGKHMIRGHNDVNSFNLFGIKANADWHGPRVNHITVEYRDGIVHRQQAAFRAYGSLAESFEDYTRFLQKPRYQQALDVSSDSGQFLHQLQRAGYATDPKYAEKISALMARDSFRAQVAELKSASQLQMISQH